MQPEDNIDLEGLEKFAKEFKRRRIELGTAAVVIIVIKTGGGGESAPPSPSLRVPRRIHQPRETKDSTCGPNPYGSRSQSQEEPLR